MGGGEDSETDVGIRGLGVLVLGRCWIFYHRIIPSKKG